MPGAKNFFAIAPRSFLKKEFEAKIVDGLANHGVTVTAGKKEFTFNDKK